MLARRRDALLDGALPREGRGRDAAPRRRVPRAPRRPRLDHGEAWQQLVALLGDTEAFAEHFDAFTAHNVADWLLWHDGNPNAVASCITAARENARSVREQISGEMWEAINSLFLLVGRANKSTTVSVARTRSSSSFGTARTGSRDARTRR